MFLIQVLLPVLREPAVADPRLGETQRELVARFGGATAYLRAPALGDWTSAAGSRERDTVVMVEVVTREFDRTWWRRYSASLATRFAQDVIHVRAMRVEMLDEEAI